MAGVRPRRFCQENHGGRAVIEFDITNCNGEGWLWVDLDPYSRRFLMVATAKNMRNGIDGSG
ncbi:hypothetical protein [Mesorhizobium sp.]|uniref:hypothetical protein n=1 Tax=Mesorhizobium sp. TaxID=1871066 RepID=UPI0025DEFCA9|nr:hypothetical protein [Mesorhizobium sp.]